MTQSPGQTSNGTNLTLPATQATPAVQADWETGFLLMVGESYPENTFEIFEDIIAWVDSYLNETDQPLRLELRLNYLNTSSIRAMIDIFDKLQAASDQGRDLSVAWLYDSRNPRSAELGEEFKEDYSFEFIISSIVE